jgi:hypothetical protein
MDLQDEFSEIGSKRPITPTDIIRVVGSSEPMASPCGKFIAFVRTRVNEPALDKKQSRIYVVATEADKDG